MSLSSKAKKSATDDDRPNQPGWEADEPRRPKILPLPEEEPKQVSLPKKRETRTVTGRDHLTGEVFTFDVREDTDLVKAFNWRDKIESHDRVGNGYVKTGRSLYRILGLEQGAFLGFLIDWFLTHGFNFDSQDAINDGWFFVTGKQLREHLNITPNTRTRLVRKLEELGFIETKMSDKPFHDKRVTKKSYQVQLIRIRFYRIVQAIQELPPAPPKQREPRKK